MSAVDVTQSPAVPVDRTAELLAFEAAHPTPDGGRKEDAIYRELGMTPARYYQLLLRLIDTDQALRLDPVLVHRLRRLRDDAARRTRFTY